MEHTAELDVPQLLGLRSSSPLSFACTPVRADQLGSQPRSTRPYLDRTAVGYVQCLRASRSHPRAQRCRQMAPSHHLQTARALLYPKAQGARLRGRRSGRLAQVAPRLGRVAGLLLDSGSMVCDYLKSEPVRQLLDGHDSRREDHHKLPPSLALFEQWLRSTQPDRQHATRRT